MLTRIFQVSMGLVTLGERVTVIGFGSGIPAKVDQGGFVIDPRDSIQDYFVASTDTFGM